MFAKIQVIKYTNDKVQMYLSAVKTYKWQLTWSLLNHTNDNLPKHC